MLLPSSIDASFITDEDLLIEKTVGLQFPNRPQIQMAW
jgi:hypothetical protein